MLIVASAAFSATLSPSTISLQVIGDLSAFWASEPSLPTWASSSAPWAVCVAHLILWLCGFFLLFLLAGLLPCCPFIFLISPPIIPFLTSTPSTTSSSPLSSLAHPLFFLLQASLPSPLQLQPNLPRQVFSFVPVGGVALLQDLQQPLRRAHCSTLPPCLNQSSGYTLFPHC